MNDQVLYTPVLPGLRLYRESAGRAGAFLIIPPDIPMPGEIRFTDAISSSPLCATFLFSDPPLPAGSTEQIEAVLTRTAEELRHADTRRGVMWLRGDKCTIMPLAFDSSSLAGHFLTEAIPGLHLEMVNGTKLTPDETGVQIFDEGLKFSEKRWITLSVPQLILSGREGGCFRFSVYLDFAALCREFPLGVRFFFGEGKNTRQVRLTLFDSRQTSVDMASLDFRICPDARPLTCARFAKQTKIPVFPSNLRTIYGRNFTLSPVTDTQNPEHCAGFYFPEASYPDTTLPWAPMGEFKISEGGQMLCGLQGTEYIEMPPEGSLIFVPNQPAFSPYFPANELSISDFMKPPDANLLTDRYSTSWVRCGSGCAYASQPREAPLYGGTGSLLLHESSPRAIAADNPPFPLAPYAGLPEKPGPEDAGRSEAADFEDKILSPTRTRSMAGALSNACGVSDNNAAVRTVATPGGHIVSLDAAGAWRSILLTRAGTDFLRFNNPNAVLTRAFQTAGLFLVAANRTNLSNFENELQVEDWRFTLPVGTRSGYNNYRDVMLIKSGPGKLYDPCDRGAGLAANPRLWTQRDDFSSPYSDGRVDAAQQTNLASWLAEYFESAYAQRSNPYFKAFAAIITDPNWQGVLFLNVSIGKESLPESLAGVCSGLPEGTSLALHHLGVRLSPVTPGPAGPVQERDGAVFGLIYFIADGYTGSALPPAAGDFDFKLLEFKVLFVNSAVARFESASQLTLGRILGGVPNAGGCAYHSVMLRGTCQINNGSPVYAMRSGGESEFLFDSLPFSQVTVSSASMETVDIKADKYRFALSCEIEFAKTALEDGREFDLFSYDNLRVSGLTLSMEGAGKTRVFSFETDAAAFDLPHSITRPGSLCADFALVPESFAKGDKDNPPAKQGYGAIVLPGLKQGGFDGGWYGLRARAILGGLGELASGVGLDCHILLAWDGTGRRYLGLSLPNSVLLQNVLALSLGMARLAVDKGHYVLMLSDIAIKCFGILKLPPGGSISFYLFGGKKTGDALGWYAMYKKDGK